MKLEIKHLAAYLPYGIKIMSESESSKQKIYNLMSIDIGINMINFGYGAAKELTEIKPILRPLSDLTKEITHNSEKFVPIYKLCKMQGFSMNNPNSYEYSYSDTFNKKVAMIKDKDWMFRYLDDEKSFWLNGIADYNKKHQKSRHQLTMFQKLYEWHFDTFGLIENGLATDINT